MTTNQEEEEEQQEQITEKSNVDDPTKRKLKVSYSWFIKSLRDLIIDTFSVRSGADIVGTVAIIKKDSEFKGHSIWILIFSIIIASIGLNLNSAAVVIGAMLVSPLMGPIQGIGLSLATNDFETLVISLRNLVIMVLVSIITSFIFFKLSPFHEAQSELLGRTRPHLFDALVAIFGGLAGIIGSSRTERGNVIPGVAIATALMPPLCTAGYGLATQQYDFFLGASYLFLINSAFICITTIVVIKFLKVPLVHYVNPRKENLIRLLLTVLAFIVIVPSIVTLYGVTKRNSYNHQISLFIKEHQNYNDSYLMDNRVDYNIHSESVFQSLYNEIFNDTSCIASTLYLTNVGDALDSTEVRSMQSLLGSYVINTELKVNQRKDKTYEFSRTIDELQTNSIEYKEAYTNAQQQLTYQSEHIQLLELELSKYSKDSIPLKSMQNDIKIFYPEVKKVEAGYISNDSEESVPVFIVYWDKKFRSISQKRKMKSNITKWIKTKISKDSVAVLSY